MKVIYTDNRYGSGDGPIFNPDYEYLLFRQDWSGNEAVYFNSDEKDNVLDKIKSGEIKMYVDYSVLYCNTPDLMNKVKDEFNCNIMLSRK